MLCFITLSDFRGPPKWILSLLIIFKEGTGYEYDGNVFVAWVLQVRRAVVVTMINLFPDMDTYFTEINHVLLASRDYEYDGFLFKEMGGGDKLKKQNCPYNYF